MRLNQKELQRRIAQVRQRLHACDLCPRNCRVDRTAGTVGVCRATTEIEIAYAGLHRGEEPPITGRGGAGAIFFSRCNLACSYCQNWQISQPGQQPIGKGISPRTLAETMLDLQRQGAATLDLVTPTHYLPGILEALADATARGLTLPIVYNTSGYESADIIKLLDGIVDVYLPDLRYSDDAMALRHSRAPHYVDRARTAVREMFHQVGKLQLDANGVARQGLIVRLLVMPNNVAGIPDSLRWLASLSLEIHISLMAQYTPAFGASSDPALNRPVSADEYAAAVQTAEELGFSNGWHQDLESTNQLIPNFATAQPFT